MMAKRAKFRKGQIVVPWEWDNGKKEDDRPIKLWRRKSEVWVPQNEVAWIDTWGNTYMESQLRAQTRREKGDAR